MTQYRLTQAKVKKIFNYQNGKLYWNIKVARNIKIGDRAGSLHLKLGYRSVSIKNKSYREARIIFLYHHGYFPDQLDHINCIKDDNRIENLRSVTHSQSNMNRSKQKKRNCTSKYKGVSFHKSSNKWQSRICKDRIFTQIGLYKTEEEAAEAYNQAASELFGKYAYLNIIEK